MRITRKVFSSKNLINTIKERAFCEGYLAAQREFAENITWKRGEKLNESDIKEVEATFGITLPNDYKSIVIKNNNARPSISTFDTESSKGHVFKKLLSLKKNDIETVYKAKKVLSKIDNTLIPFANDPAGNYLCFKGDSVVYWQHEDNSISKIANNFTEFLAKLY